MKIRPLFSVLLGNSMQFYDFTIYAFLAQNIANSFFYLENSIVSYLLVLGVFASGYLVRPLGALLFGHIGDKLGRSRALSYTVVLTALSTFCIGLLPDSKSIGILAPIALVFLRLVQGLSVSGEEGGAVVLIMEKNSFKNKGFIGAVVISSVLFGIVMGALVCEVTSIFFSSSSTWSWRVPFLLSLPIGLVAAKLRFRVNDFKDFIKNKKMEETFRIPTLELIRQYKTRILKSVLIVSLYSMSTSILIVNLPFVLKVAQFKETVILPIVVMAVGAVAILTPVFGRMADLYGDLKVLRLSFILMTLVFPIGFFMLQFSTSVISVFIFIISASITTSLISSVVFSSLIDNFPFGVRYSGVSFSFNLSITVFSSLTPVVLAFLESRENGFFLSGIYMLFISILVIILSEVISKKTNVAINK